MTDSAAYKPVEERLRAMAERVRQTCPECGGKEREQSSQGEGRWVIAATGEPWDGAPGVGIKWVGSDD